MRLIYILLSLCVLSSAYGQIKKPTIVVENSAILSVGEYAPFWLISNKYGVYSTKNNQYLLRLKASAALETSRAIDYFYGLDGASRVDSKFSFFFNEAYFGIKAFDFNFYCGIKNEHYGTQDSMLSMGGFLYSGNARSIPRLSFRSNDYVYVPYTYKWLETKFGISHGWLGDSLQFVENAFIHDKYFYLKLKISNKLKIYGGLHHVVMWGGTSRDSVVGNLRAGWNEFRIVFFAEHAEEGVGPLGEEINRYGNHIASYHFGLDYSDEKYSVNFYWQTMLEDKNGRVGIDWKNSSDGLWGISYTNNDQGCKIKKVVLEFFNSTNQSGDLKKSGGDDYFNNYVYRSGWTNYGMVNGSPVITSPTYYNSNPMSIRNNRVRAFHIGTMAKFGQFNIVSKTTYTLNFGRHNFPSTVNTKQFYSCIDVHFLPIKLRATELVGSFGIDLGEWLGNNWGTQLTYRKYFNL